MGKALDYAVGKANGWVNYPEDSIEHGNTWHCDPEKAPFGRTIKLADYKPSTNWIIAGRIIEDEKLQLSPSKCGKYWQVVSHGDNWFCCTGEEPLLTLAMRCYAASKLGKEIEIPDNLLGE